MVVDQVDGGGEAVAARGAGSHRRKAGNDDLREGATVTGGSTNEKERRTEKRTEGTRKIAGFPWRGRRRRGMAGAAGVQRNRRRSRRR